MRENVESNIKVLELFTFVEDSFLSGVNFALNTRVLIF